MATFEEAMLEACASAPSNEIIYYTIEMHHPAFEVPIRLVQGNDDIKARLEKDAPRNAGEIVEFIGAPWDLTLPSIEEDQVPEIQLTFDNVSREINQNISAAVKQGEPVKIIFRPYLDSALEYGPQMNPPIEMEISSATANNYQIQISANVEDVFHAAFPLKRYTNDRFPTINYAS